jgi:hypothetical protein
MPVSPAPSGSLRRGGPVQSEASLRLGGFEFLNLRKCRLHADVGINSATRMISNVPVFIGVFRVLENQIRTQDGLASRLQRDQSLC